MTITRQVFLSYDTDTHELMYSIGFDNNLKKSITNPIQVAQAETIEWLLAPDSGIKEITNIQSNISAGKMGNCWNTVIQMDQPPATVENEIQFTLNNSTIIPPPANGFIEVVLIQKRPARVVTIYFSVVPADEIPIESAFQTETDSWILASHYPDDQFQDHETFLTEVFPGDIIIWQFAPPARSNGGIIAGIRPKDYDSLFSSIVYTQNICVGTVNLDATSDIPYSYSVRGKAYQGTVLTDFNFDPKIKVIAS